MACAPRLPAPKINKILTICLTVQAENKARRRSTSTRGAQQPAAAAAATAAGPAASTDDAAAAAAGSTPHHDARGQDDNGELDITSKRVRTAVQQLAVVQLSQIDCTGDQVLMICMTQTASAPDALF
jgi:predicted lipid-binding transport protein (Tim44 family)